MTPRPSLSHPGHFATFLECSCLEDCGQSPLPLDFGLPSLRNQDANEYVCSICKRYVFRSAADKDRHLSVIHDRRGQKRAADKESASSSRKCTFNGCGKEFDTAHQLQRHKAEAGHKCARGWPKNGTDLTVVIVVCVCGGGGGGAFMELTT